MKHNLAKTLLFAWLCTAMTPANAQLKLSAIAGVSYNMPEYTGDQENLSPNLYGNAVGGYLGARIDYGLSKRFSIGSELTYQILPYTNKYVTGKFYPNYATLSVIPAFTVSPKLQIEAGLGTGITLVSRFANKKNNDPLAFATAGFRIPVGQVGIVGRYYHFFRPLSVETSTRGETNFRNSGFSLGLTYRLSKG